MVGMKVLWFSSNHPLWGIPKTVPEDTQGHRKYIGRGVKFGNSDVCGWCVYGNRNHDASSGGQPSNTE